MSSLFDVVAHTVFSPLSTWCITGGFSLSLHMYGSNTYSIGVKDLLPLYSGSVARTDCKGSPNLLCFCIAIPFVQ